MASVTIDGRTGNFLIRAYAGINPDTRTPRTISTTLPASVSDDEVDAACDELDARAAVLKGHSEAMTIGAALGYYLSEMDELEVMSPTTISSYLSYLEKHIRPRIGTVYYDEADERLFSDFYRLLMRPKLDGGAERFLLEAKVPYAIGYGLTETAPLLAGAAPSQVRLGSTGPQAPGVELRLENVNPETRQGEIVARTPSAMVGYFKNPEATKEAFTADGWFRTGDLGEFDKDGWLYIKGRLKNMIVGPGGENIYPEDIETVLNSHVYIADSIVTEQQGRLVALVHFNRDEIESMIDDWREEWTSKKEALEAKTEQLKKEILDFVNAKVNRFSRISEVVEEKDDFVKTPTHKIKRFLYSKKKESGTPGEHPAGRPETK